MCRETGPRIKEEVSSEMSESHMEGGGLEGTRRGMRGKEGVKLNGSKHRPQKEPVNFDQFKTKGKQSMRIGVRTTNTKRPSGGPECVQ